MNIINNRCKGNRQENGFHRANASLCNFLGSTAGLCEAYVVDQDSLGQLANTHDHTTDHKNGRWPWSCDLHMTLFTIYTTVLYCATPLSLPLAPPH